MDRARQKLEGKMRVLDKRVNEIQTVIDALVGETNEIGPMFDELVKLESAAKLDNSVSAEVIEAKTIILERIKSVTDTLQSLSAENSQYLRIEDLEDPDSAVESQAEEELEEEPPRKSSRRVASR
jgi:hypothetical protein